MRFKYLFSYTLFWKYVKNPKFIVASSYSIQNNIIFLISSYFFLFLCSIVIILFLLPLDYFIVHVLHYTSIFAESRSSQSSLNISLGKYAILIEVLLVPLIEEVIFRGPLRLNKIMITLSIALLVYVFSKGHLFHKGAFWNTSNLWRLPLILILSIIINKILTVKNINLIKLKFYKQWFYFWSLLFGLVHLSNFNHINYSIIYIYPLFVFPQIAMGFFIGYIRMERGFLWGWALHMLINFVSLSHLL